MWHASIGVLGPDWRPLPTARVPVTAQQDARVITRRLLAGVGGTLEKAHRGSVAFHLRRELTNQEIALLDPEWVALPAIDGGSEDE